MTDLGLALVWLAVQDALVVGPVAWVQGRVGRANPAAGAWVAAVGLGLVLLLPLALAWPRSDRAMPTPAPLPSPPVNSAPIPGATANAAPTATPTRPSGWLRVPRLAWAGVERRVAPAVDRWRPAARFVAPAVGAMVALGLLRLLGGLVAVEVWRRRGRAVADGGLLAELDALRAALGCRHRRPVAVREVAGLGAPAVAGWWRPVIFVPDVWREWSATDRRAVLAHELAHLARGDYAAGLLGHLARAIHAHHPAVAWLMARMVRDQEAAADRAAAEVAGGRTTYRVALARLALRIDDEARSPNRLARAFLPRRGGLVRRMALLAQEETSMAKTWTRPRKLLVVATLAALTLGVGSLPDPIHADEAPTAPTTGAVIDPSLICLGDDRDGIVGVRPATLIRLAGDGPLAATLDSLMADLLQEFAELMHLDRSRPMPLKLSARDVEWASSGFRTEKEKAPNKKPEEQMERIEFEGPVVRTIVPFDWLGFLRQWGFTPTEVRVGNQVYYKGVFDRVPYAIYLPDDRTLIFGSEDRIRAVMNPATKRPALVDGPDWDQARRGWLAISLVNRDGKLDRLLDERRPDDVLAMPLLRGVKRWTLHAADASPTTLCAVARTEGKPTAAGVVSSIGVLRALGLKVLESGQPVTDPSITLPRSVLTALQTRQDETSVRLDASVADLLPRLVKLIVGAKISLDEEEARADRDKRPEIVEPAPHASRAPVQSRGTQRPVKRITVPDDFRPEPSTIRVNPVAPATHPLISL